jgi:gliding motility-associated-like protein
MRKILLLILWLGLGLPIWSYASHIVGGEIQFYPVDRNAGRYYVGLNLYFDVVNGRPTAEDPTINIYFFRKSDNVLVGGVELPQVVRKLISYSNPTCDVIDDLNTRLITYSSEITMNSGAFNDPAGYYIVWERCCRNNIINNIVNPGSVGEAFYLAFPPLSTVNSSPRVSELKGDYICLNRPFNFDFSAKDSDGDSLVYSLVRPYAGFTSPNLSRYNAPPAQGSSNYPQVTWAPGINDQNIIPGPVPLRINSKTGQLNVTAGKTGLYVFAVQIDEYRQGKRIGIVRREFQLKVVDCPANAKPAALFREVGKKDFYKAGEVVRIKSNQPKCLEVFITDPDPNQRVSISTKALNFDDKSLTVSPTFFTTRTANDTLKVQICLEKCVESVNNQPVILEVIVSDDGCPQGLSDTLRVRVLVEPSNNNKPNATTDLVNNQALVPPGAALRFNALGKDTDNDDLLIEARGRGFQLAQVGMTFNNATGKGTVTSPFTWSPTCDAANREYVVDFIVTDVGCSRQLRDTVTVRLRANLRPNRPPTISSSVGMAVNQQIDVEAEAQTMSFDVFGDDADPDQLRLYAQGRGFELSKYKIQFQDKSGTPRLTSSLSWSPDCQTMEELAGKTLTIDFFVEDNSCGPIRRDTLTMLLNVPVLPTQAELKNLPNVITPNGDGKNDCFFVTNLVKTRCGPQFERVEIYNRWGRLTYSSEDPAFRWCAENITAGTYFYTIKFTKEFVKGTLTVLR